MMQTVVDYLALNDLHNVVAAVVTRLSLAMLVVFAIALALVRRAVTLSARVVIAGAHWRFALVPAVVIFRS
jgi:hypothetical protein